MDLKVQYDRLLRYCYSITKDRYLSEDIVQETLLRFWESKSYKDMGKRTGTSLYDCKKPLYGRIPKT